MKIPDPLAFAWLSVLSAATFLTFGYDKWRASRPGQRVPEAFLVLLGALGGWPGGLLGMGVFRHKTSKWSFQLKYALALIPFAAGVWVWLKWR